MLIPDLPAPAVTRDSTTIFAGLRLSGRPADGEFVRTENLSTDRYPILAPRRRRAVAAALTDPGGLIEKDAPGYVADGTLYFAGAPSPPRSPTPAGSSRRTPSAMSRTARSTSPARPRP